MEYSTCEERMVDKTGGYRIRMEGVGVEGVVATARNSKLENVTEDWMWRKRGLEKTEACL